MTVDPSCVPIPVVVGDAVNQDLKDTRRFPSALYKCPAKVAALPSSVQTGKSILMLPFNVPLHLLSGFIAW